jgi:hypothetical protein
MYGEILSGLLTLGWGLTILFPTPSDVTSSVMVVMTAMLPAAVWGGTICVLGFLQLFGVVLNKRDWRRQSSFLIFPVWAALSVLILVVGITTSPGFFIYGLFGLFCAWTNFRLLIGRY